MPAFDIFFTLGFEFWFSSLIGNTSKIFGLAAEYTLFDYYIVTMIAKQVMSYAISGVNIPPIVYSSFLFLPAASTTISLKIGAGAIGVTCVGLIYLYNSWGSWFFFAVCNG